MEFKSISTKMPRNETTLLDTYCKKKGITISALIRELLLKEIKITAPNNEAGRNKLVYNKDKDNFSWLIELDDKTNSEVLKNVSSGFIEDLMKEMENVIKERETFINKKRKGSISVPSRLIRK